MVFQRLLVFFATIIDRIATGYYDQPQVREEVLRVVAQELDIDTGGSGV